MELTFNERMELLAERVRKTAKEPYLWRTLLSAAAIFSIALPWAHLDGNQQANSGTSLIAHLFTGTERIAMLRESPLGFITLFVTPLAAVPLTVNAFWKTWKEQEPMMLHLVLLALPLPMLMFAGSLTSTQHQMFGSRLAPQAGVIVLMLSQAALVAMTLLIETRRQNQARREREYPTAESHPEETEPLPGESAHGGTATIGVRTQEPREKAAESPKPVPRLSRTPRSRRGRKRASESHRSDV